MISDWTRLVDFKSNTKALNHLNSYDLKEEIKKKKKSVGIHIKNWRKNLKKILLYYKVGDAEVERT
jgi:hypothetical protein